MSFADLESKLDRACVKAFAETALYDGTTDLEVVISEHQPVTDDMGNVIAEIDEVEIFQCPSIETGKTLQTSTRTYRIQKYRRTDGAWTVYQIV